MGNIGVLFGVKGRIGPASFWRGAILLIGAGIVLNILSAYVSWLFSFAGLLFIYPYVSVYGKRLHDNGRTAWLVLLVIAVTFAISYALGLIIQPMLGVDIATFEAEMNAAAEAGDLAAVMALTQEASRAQLLPTLITSLITSLIVAFGVAQLKSDPGANQFGPPEGGAVDGDNDVNDIFS